MAGYFRTRIKICGVRELENAELCVELGVWAIGLNCYRRSPRRVAVADAEAIGQVVKRRIQTVGVFVNAKMDRVVQLAERCHLTTLQFHGDEGPQYCGEVARRTGLRVIKAQRIRTLGDLNELERFQVDFHLLDSGGTGVYGGSGRTFDWDIARSIRAPQPFIVGGGLTPENVGEAIKTMLPFGVDVASGVESSPGQQDPARIAKFVDAVADADREIGAEREQFDDVDPDEGLDGPMQEQAVPDRLVAES